MRKRNIIKSIVLLGLFGILSSGIQKNVSQVRATDVIAPKARWLLNNPSDVGYDSATLDGTNKYHLTNYNGVTCENGVATFGDSMLYAENIENDPTYQDTAKDDMTLCFSLSIPDVTWSKNVIPVNIRWSSNTCFALFTIKQGTHDLYYANTSNKDTDYFTSGKILTLEPNRTYDFAMSVSIYDKTRIYVDGNPNPIYEGESFTGSLNSKWTIFAFGGCGRCRNGGHIVDIFESFCSGMKLSNAAFYDFAFTADLAKEFHETQQVTGDKPEQYIPPFIHDEKPDFNVIRDSKLKSRVFMVADPHYRGDSGPQSWGDTNVLGCFDDINSLKLDGDALLMLGDLSDTGCDRSRSTLQNWYDLMDTKPVHNIDGTPIPYYGILGNHDARGDASASHSDKERYEDFLVTAALYQQREDYTKWKASTKGKGSYGDNQTFPDLNYVREINGYHYVFVNPAEPQWDACYLTTEDYNWIDNTLTSLEESDGNKPIFLLVHQTLDLNNQGVYVLDENGKKINDEYYLIKMLSKHETTVVCTGHTHNPLGQNHLFQGVYYDGVKLANAINLPSLEWNQYDDYVPRGVKGYELKTDEYRTEIQYYVLEIYENGLIFRARDGVRKVWREDCDMGILFKGKVTFKDTDGTILSEKTYNCGEEIVVPNDPDTSSLPLTEFKEWKPKVSKICHGDIVYTANYVTRPEGSPETFNVTFVTNGHGELPDKIVKYGFPITNLPSLEDPGYEFEGWFVNKSCTQTIDYENVSLTSNMTLYAKWKTLTNIQYKVQHFVESKTGEEYELVSTQTLTGTTGELTKAIKNKGLTDYIALPFEQKVIKGDGSTIVEIYYNRPIYSITVSNDDSKGVYELSSSTAKFGSTVKLTINPFGSNQVEKVLVNESVVEVNNNVVLIENVYDNLKISIKYVSKEAEKNSNEDSSKTTIILATTIPGGCLLIGGLVAFLIVRKKNKINKIK